VAHVIRRVTLNNKSNQIKSNQINPNQGFKELLPERRAAWALNPASEKKKMK
jgi:hypothetical protein